MTGSAPLPASVFTRFTTGGGESLSGNDPLEAERALREVLRLDPDNGQAKRNLEALYRNTGRWVEGVLDPPPS